MFIKTQKYFMTGNGGLGHKDVAINTDDISNIVECGFESRPYTGLRKISMKNGDKFYSSLRIEDLK